MGRSIADKREVWNIMKVSTSSYWKFEETFYDRTFYYCFDTMTFTLPDLPYAYDALEPTIDTRTMQIHHTKHHAWYTSKLNAALAWTDHENTSIEELLWSIDALPADKQWAVRNNWWGYANHCLFREIMTPGGKNMSESFSSLLTETFGSIEAMKESFSTHAKTRFGSGWAWISVTSEGKLIIESTPNQDSPLMQGRTPILWLDVWEHAYYLNYQNRRPDYVEAWWSIVNWQQVEANYNSAIA